MKCYKDAQEKRSTIKFITETIEKRKLQNNLECERLSQTVKRKIYVNKTM